MSKTTILASENGPILVMADGKVATALCRCGHSSKKPFCDGTHHKTGFRAEKAEVKIPD